MDMQKNLIAALALSLGASGLAFAQADGDRQARERGQAQIKQGARDAKRNARPAPQIHANANQRRDERGAGPDHEWHRGDRLPAEYRHNNYVVDDWRSHHLSAPPRGYHWVQAGSDYVLVAIATGVIAQLLLDNR
jgi:Ni/Co efflux regulator RcnB